MSTVHWWKHCKGADNSHPHIFLHITCYDPQPSTAMPTPPLWVPPSSLPPPACARSFSSQDTLPLPKCLNVAPRWSDAFQIVDGHFSPDGGQLVVSDTAGQHHLYGLGPPAAPAAMAACPYDQFFATDYSPLTRDLNGCVRPRR